MGMSRSGSSLTASVIAALLGRQPGSWRGSGAALATNSQNRLGYFERADVVSMNHALATRIAQRSAVGWYVFPTDFAVRPRDYLHEGAAAATALWKSVHEPRARGIVADMEAHAPWLLKDVRFARTLPLWRPLLSRPVCILPYRHPLEVQASSTVRAVDRLTLWRNYMLSAVVAAQEAECPIMFVAYDSWLNATLADDQLIRLHSFLRCAGVPGLPQRAPTKLLGSIVRPEERHHDASSPALRNRSPRLPPSVGCAWEWLRESDVQQRSGQRRIAARGDDELADSCTDCSRLLRRHRRARPWTCPGR